MLLSLTACSCFLSVFLPALSGSHSYSPGSLVGLFSSSVCSCSFSNFSRHPYYFSNCAGIFPCGCCHSGLPIGGSLFTDGQSGHLKADNPPSAAVIIRCKCCSLKRVYQCIWTASSASGAQCGAAQCGCGSPYSCGKFLTSPPS